MGRPSHLTSSCGGKGRLHSRPLTESLLHSQEEEEKRKKNDNDTLDELPPRVEWPWCVIPIEVKTEQNRGATANKDAFVQLGTYIREVFAAQENRRFVPSLILTECTVEFLLWDRGGVVVSERIDYHNEQQNNHILFCNILASLVTWDDQQLGFDPTVRYDQMVPPIRTGDSPQPIKGLHIGVVEGVKCAKGGICRSTKKLTMLLRRLSSAHTLSEVVVQRVGGLEKLQDGKPDGAYLILDSWVRVARKRSKISFKRCRTYARSTAYQASHPWCILKTLRFREQCRTKMPFTTTVAVLGLGPKDDLIHTRTVLLCDGVLLEHFADEEELLVTLHDVIQGTLSLVLPVIHGQYDLQDMEKHTVMRVSCIGTSFREHLDSA